MYASFDRHSPMKLDSKIHCLSWKGNAKQGWLALGNSLNTVGITYTELNDDIADNLTLSSSESQPETSLEKQGMRRNFNFREHTHEVTIVRWNSVLDKIATCDSSGTVIVWRNHNGRSIMELVNNRGSKISDFQWSRDGSKVLITYTDGYVLLGTAFGRRIWARQLNIGTFVTTPSNHTQSSELLSSTWSPDDSRIVVGSSIGELIELDAHHNGSLVSTTEVLPGIGIIGLQWVQIPCVANDKSNVRLSLYLKNGKVVLMNSCGDQQATIIRTGLVDGKMIWSKDGSILAVAGLRKSQGISTVRFFQPSGQLLFTLPLGTKDSITAITWAHNDTKLFIAANHQLYTLTVDKEVPLLQSLCHRVIAASLHDRDRSFELVLPTRIKVGLADSFNPVVKGHVPKDNLLEYVSKPPPPLHRVYCTLIPSSVIPTTAVPSNHQSSTNTQRNNRHPIKYTLYIEHMGNLVPVLEATRRSSKLRPSFTISLPSDGSSSMSDCGSPCVTRQQPEAKSDDTAIEQNDTQNDTSIRCIERTETHTSLNTDSGIQMACKEDECDVSTRALSNANLQDGTNGLSSSLSTSSHIAEVTSQLINSKFRIQSVTDKLPFDMGTITIKTSFLHIQPRKVIVHLPPLETDSGVDSCDDCSGDETDSLVDSDVSLDSLSSLEELSDSKVSTDSRTLLNKPPRQTNASHNLSVVDNNVIIHSKTPTWNEQHMIYQLDFGGRVTTKSAKNFQLEMGSEQVLQFGRIENGSFILDFQHPFSPIQAFATALANLV